MPPTIDFKRLFKLRLVVAPWAKPSGWAGEKVVR